MSPCKGKISKPAPFHPPKDFAAAGSFPHIRHMKHLKLVIEKHSDGYIGYPVGMKGVIVGQGDSYEAALKDVQSAVRFHIETFGPDALAN